MKLLRWNVNWAKRYFGWNIILGETILGETWLGEMYFGWNMNWVKQYFGWNIILGETILCETLLGELLPHHWNGLINLPWKRNIIDPCLPIFYWFSLNSVGKFDHVPNWVPSRILYELKLDQASYGVLDYHYFC